jgi:hypothetical protein
MMGMDTDKMLPDKAQVPHAWTGDGNRCAITGYDGPICGRCNLPDTPGTPDACKGVAVEEEALIKRLNGRAKYLRSEGAIKTSGLLTEAADRLTLLETSLATVRVNLLRAPENALVIGEFAAAILRGATLLEAAKASDSAAAATPTQPHQGRGDVT